jgi:hypothetical protein
MYFFFTSRLAHAPPPISIKEIPIYSADYFRFCREGRGAGFFCIVKKVSSRGREMSGGIIDEASNCFP